MKRRIGYGQAHSRVLRENRRLRAHLAETPEKEMGVRPEHEMFGEHLHDFRHRARAWFLRCPF